MEDNKKKSDKLDECFEIKISGDSNTLVLKNARIDGNTLVLDGPAYSVKNGCLIIKEND